MKNEPSKKKAEIVQFQSSVEPSNFCLPATYSIHVEGLLDDSWSERLAGMNISKEERKNLAPVTTLTGRLVDQAELLGVLNALYNLGITLMTVKRLD